MLEKLLLNLIKILQLYFYFFCWHAYCQYCSNQIGIWVVRLTLIFFIVGITGSLLFFPVPIEGQRSCMMDFFINKGQEPGTQFSHSSGDHCAMVQKYIVPYGLSWWLSLVITYQSVRRMVKLRYRIRMSGLFHSIICSLG